MLKKLLLYIYIYVMTSQNVIVEITVKLYETYYRFIDECLNRRFESDINGINEVAKEAFKWIRALDIKI